MTATMDARIQEGYPADCLKEHKPEAEGIKTAIDAYRFAGFAKADDS